MIRGRVLLLAAMACSGCEELEGNGLSKSIGQDQAMGQWFQLDDGSQVWFFKETNDIDIIRSEVLRCWPVDQKMDCVRVLQHNITGDFSTSATRFQIEDLMAIDDFLNDWRPRIVYNCSFEGSFEPPIETIGDIENTLRFNITMPGESFTPWQKQQVTSWLNQAGVDMDSYVNCRNLALMIRANEGVDRILWEGDVRYEDLAS